MPEEKTIRPREASASTALDSVVLEFFGVSVTPRTTLDVARHLEGALDRRGSSILAAHNLHSVYLFHTNSRFRAFYEVADLVLIDGRPLLTYLNKVRRRRKEVALSSAYRIGSTDWIDDAISLVGIRRICVLGASESANADFLNRYEGAGCKKFLGIPADPWEPDKAKQTVEQVRQFQPDITLVALGMPLQESVALLLREANVGGVIATVGGAIDQLSGHQVHAPRWLGKIGLEWTWRLASHPRRLAHRYLVEPFILLSILRKKTSTR
ncbi:WecB/TagA/CpsF family glycosyltransferase [Microbacterium sp. 179-B 1A2 NHS]|uniref:WecB/TagA/CpsF family glycosyltransferase n=1 Tax=Microbacterium sp. 179-B 1A2 NHS TaxID=3142383 RepID=UPI00399EF8E9